MAGEKKAIPVKLIEACKEWGCFRVLGLLPKSLMSEMKEVVRQLLALPMEIKMRNKPVIAGSGYMPPSEINPLYESLGFLFMLWIPSLPSLVLLLTKVHDLQICRGLGVSGVTFGQFRINKYSFTPQTVGSSGVQLHTDTSLLTILQDDESVGGLEVMTRAGHFQAVDPCPGTLVVNLGDIAPVWSNGRFLNVKHRVMCKEAGVRLSIASFLLGPKAGLVEAPPELVDLECHRRFSRFTYQEFRNFKLCKKMYDGEVLDHFKSKN